MCRSVEITGIDAARRPGDDKSKLDAKFHPRGASFGPGAFSPSLESSCLRLLAFSSSLDAPALSGALSLPLNAQPCRVRFR